MPEWTVTELRRTLTPEQADELIGDDVPDTDPTLTGATVAVDADTHAPVFAYLPQTGTAELRRAVLGLRYRNLYRAGGSVNASRTFGYAPRRPSYRREGCALTALAAENPDTQQVLNAWAARLQTTLSDIDPRIVETDTATLSDVDPSWRLGESTLWTSGVINQSSRLPYHRDRFNFATWSAMPVLRRNMTGGHLAIPEYDTVLPCRDGWAVFFPGHALVHGVTPMHPTAPDGYRYSIVYYALRGMQDCFTAALETKYATRRRTERERAMAKRLQAGEPIPR